MTYLLSLGSNLGNREQTLRNALQCIEQRIGPVLRCSSFFYSEPWEFQSDHPFCNLCCAVQTDLSPIDMLRSTQVIEQELGRTAKTNPSDPHYQDRTIDIDLIRAFDEQGTEMILQHLPSDPYQSLILPHPLWQERDFVRIPLQEITTN